jgi:hypothetical protein
MATLNLANLTFPATILYDGDHLAIKSIQSPHTDTWAWSNNVYRSNTPGQNVRGRFYVSRLRWGYFNNIPSAYGPVAGYGLGYAGSGLGDSYDTISYYNASRVRSIRVLVEAGPTNPASFQNQGTTFERKQVSVKSANAGRPTDDTTRHLLYRGGSPSNNFTHSGGTLLQQEVSGLIFIDTIPANTTFQYWHYAGTTGGSGGDHVATYLRASFIEFV